MSDESTQHRFLTIEQAAEELNVKQSLIRGLIKTGELRAIQIGGRGLWRTARQDLEDYVAEAYQRTAESIASGEIIDDGEPDVE
ncbi:helix-turn-helix domain-containing protein [Pseudarthrobacter sp. AB1]|uniref:helix-turn-helix domain-containing protein n=1 Tax=Pseudarthrobacter sp. AB1 TaxID=2138309 RepID=UPI00186B755E|nr:helix-turn-helix domain-containing protein [Pseudarthrobacter sp. AB1]MBE4720126.1 DNA-binding protein [Pseudarthrobacter sp. AB1]